MIYKIFRKKPLTKYTYLKTICSFLFLIVCFSTAGQNNVNDSLIIPAYNNYTQLSREVGYLHLNKSTYIKGEVMGFSAYILDKETKKPSKLTKNLYCIIKDSTQNIIKSKLINVENGYAHNTFDIDSTFSSGNYTLIAFTNWMRNFEEQNYFTENIKVIDPEKEEYIRPSSLENVMDAKFLPEGGHLVANIQNTMGVIIKNSEGYGIPNIEGNLIDSNGDFVTNFKTNELGIGKFLMTPLLSESYKAEIEHFGKKFLFEIEKPKAQGIAFSLTDLGNKIAISLKTNSESFSFIKNKTFNIAIHNGHEMKVIDFEFTELEILKIIPYNQLFTGVNIITIFEKEKPLLERLFFNYEGISLMAVENPTLKKANDSIEVKMRLSSLNTKITKQISISVLPSETKSYNRNHNILSYTLLQPYLRSPIENGTYYFTNISRKTQYDLDNLLITQGWSSYDWNSVFNYPPKVVHLFENGIGFKASINNSNNNSFFIFPLTLTDSDLIITDKNETSFIKSGLFPQDNEKIKIGELNKKGNMAQPNLYLQFYPSKVPIFNPKFHLLPPKTDIVTSTTQIQPLTYSVLDKVQLLNEVYITTQRNKTRLEQLQRRSYGTIDLFDDKKRMHNTKLSAYLSGRGFLVHDSNGNLSITVRNPSSPNNNKPIVFLDGVQLLDFGFLSTFDMSTVDYIEINKSGLGEGINGGAGSIKIFTNPDFINNNASIKDFKVYDVPLTFSAPTKFYVPKFSFYQSQFFKEYGVIDWIPNVTVDENSYLNFKIYNTDNQNINFYIEGISDDGTFVAEIKTVNIN